MVLTRQFWYEQAKKDPNKEFMEKIITNEYLITLEKKPNGHHFIFYCNYSGTDISNFIQSLITLIKVRTKELNIEPIKAIEWILRPTDTPNSIGSYLQDFGFQKIVSTFHMGIDLTTYDKELKFKEFNFETKLANYDDLFDDKLLDLTKTYFPEFFKTKEEVKQFRVESNNRILKEKSTEIHFITYKKDSNEPVAYASMLLKQELPGIGILSGALTDKEYRKKGIYSSLLFERIQYAKNLGLRYIVVDAYSETSAPILTKFGFKVFDQYENYRLVDV